MKHHDAMACVRLVPIFANLDEAALTAIAGLVHERHYAAGMSLFTAGDAAETLIIVANGQVKVSQATLSGREQMLRLLTAGDFDGEAVLFTASDYQASGVALTAVQACTITRRDFQALLRQTPELALNVLNALGQRVAELEAQTVAQATTSVGERLAAYLVETAATLGQADFELPLLKKDLAAYLGTSPETVSRRLRRFESAGYIQQHGRNHVTVLDGDGLLLAASDLT